MPDAIAYRTGTYRAADPAQTWQRVAPMLGRFGITRAADITRLDDIGLPVHVAYRPAGLTYAVSMGTG
jgi:ribosomal protein S12 methylthiotransferase accessory factor